MRKDNTNRFSDRVTDYIKFRPAYPAEMINVLENEIELNQEKVIADIGSGTGISSIPFLKNGNFVFGVEPNKEMREAQEHILKDFANFKSVDGTSEQTTLSDKSIDVIFSGQAFHWFDKSDSKIEFSRILRDSGNIVLVWNSRSTKSDFQNEYERVLYDNIKEYKDVNHRNIEDQDIANFFSPKIMKIVVLDNEQKFDLEGLKGRLRSSSYCPKEGVIYERLMRELENLFVKHQKDNLISFVYETKIYL
ncbi:class I SAM-dependent methyltransferase [Pedobacter nutrimenti]|uniref:class I SAM-dependent methyltransferase n=1 Tax=Pedobacter nutrimenti TaxID=1241337 RepID=UPI0029309CD4|nr:class I SAM-dependent methyltransferase [Pedobacter nutrimenti]